MRNNTSDLCGRSLPSGIVRPRKQGPGSGKYDFKSYGQFFSVLCGSESPNQILLRTHRRSSKEAVKRRMCLQIVCTQKKEEVTIFVVTSFSVWEHRDSNPGPSACKADALNQLSYTPSWCNWKILIVCGNHFIFPNCECKYRAIFSHSKFFRSFFQSFFTTHHTQT